MEKVLLTLTDLLGAKWNVVYREDEEYFYFVSGDGEESIGPFDTLEEAENGLRAHIYGMNGNLS